MLGERHLANHWHAQAGLLMGLCGSYGLLVRFVCLLRDRFVG